MITVAMICRDEWEYIPYSLGLAMEYADRVVVVFTGDASSPTRSLLQEMSKEHDDFILIDYPWTGCHASARRQYVPHLLDGWFWHIDADEIWYRSAVEKTIEYLPRAKAAYLNINMKHFKNTHFTCSHRFMQRVRWMKIDLTGYDYDIAGSHIADDLVRRPKGNTSSSENLLPAFGAPGTATEYPCYEKQLHVLHFSHCSEHRLAGRDLQKSMEWPVRDLLVAFPGPYPSQCKGASWIGDAGVWYSDTPPMYLVDPYFATQAWNAENERITW